LTAAVAWVEDEWDLALLRVSHNLDLEEASIAPTQSIREGKAALVIGNPLGQGQKAIAGRLGPQRIVHWDGRSAQLRAIVADVVPGNSGGGAFDLATGELLGITVAKSSTQANTGYVVPADKIASLVADRLSLRGLTDASDVRSTLGVTMRPVRLTNGRFPSGLLVTHVQSGAAAEMAGWKEGDVLVGFGQYKMDRVSDVLFVLQGAKSESTPISFRLAGAPQERIGQLRLDGAEPPATDYARIQPPHLAR
jgi:S1-C subfamily serine protease